MKVFEFCVNPKDTSDVIDFILVIQFIVWLVLSLVAQ